MALQKFHSFSLDSFRKWRTAPQNWKAIPIEFLGIFRKFIAPSEYKLSFQGHDPKGRPSYLKLYAETFSVSYRYTQVAQMNARREKMEVRRLKREIEQAKKRMAALRRKMP